MATKSQSIPAAHLENLVRGPLLFSGSELRILVALMLVDRPVSARALSQEIPDLTYSNAKRVTRDLVRAQVLHRSRVGLTVNKDPQHWRVPE